ncbi:endonuclease NucS domain-containing protein [Haloarcula laminariae]|uniref:endonuclease NucS domain-containing protein n=1 Tax=Haloarcula laminariae TaxID=2961577 RepID=UPI0021C693F1|nr:endonuclease NucS domain-containing protein [Halomicroarcula laminariae]
MVYHVNGQGLDALEPASFESIDVTEANIEEWVIETPEILGEDLLVVASQYAKFDRTAERPDVLALDPDGKLVVVELKRDRADATTDLQAIKYASYCSTISAEELQQDYRGFWNDRRDEEDQLTPDDVGEAFRTFLGEDVGTAEDGYADFALDDRPRIVLAAGSFGPEITTPVVWLEREFGMDITCVELEAHQRNDQVFISSRRVLPVPEAEEYMAKRRQKERKQSRSTSRAERAITVLLEAGLVEEGDIVMFDPGKVPNDSEIEYDADTDFWRGRITGKTGRSNNVEWLENGTEYSFTALAQAVLERATGREFNVNGYPYWKHSEHGMSLSELRRTEVGDIDW